MITREETSKTTEEATTKMMNEIVDGEGGHCQDVLILQSFLINKVMMNGGWYQHQNLILKLVIKINLSLLLNHIHV